VPVQSISTSRFRVCQRPYYYAAIIVLGLQLDIRLYPLDFRYDTRYCLVVQYVAVILNSCILTRALMRLPLAALSLHPAVRRD
jgi:hypothetical protein